MKKIVALIAVSVFALSALSFAGPPPKIGKHVKTAVKKVGSAIKKAVTRTPKKQTVYHPSHFAVHKTEHAPPMSASEARKHPAMSGNPVTLHKKN